MEHDEGSAPANEPAVDHTGTDRTGRGRLSRGGFLATVGAGTGALLLEGCGLGSSRATTSASAKGGTPITLGASVPLTGSAAADGLGFSRGIQMAIDEINALGGVDGHPLQSAILDAQDFAPDIMVNNFKRLVTEKQVDAIVGGYQLSSGPDLDIAADGGVIYIHSNTNETNAQTVAANPSRYWGIFQHCPTEVWYGRSIPGFLDRLAAMGTWKPRNHQVAIIRGNDQYTSGISAALTKAIAGTDWKIGLVEQITVPTSAWGPVLAKLDAHPVDVVWVTDFLPADEAAFMKQFVQQPTQTLVHLQYGPSNPEFVQLAGSAGEGITWATTIPLLQDTIGQSFSQRFQQKFHAPVSGTAAITYDAVHLYALGASLAGGPGDNKKIAEQIRQTPFRGVCGANYYGFSPDQTVRPYPAYTQDSGLGMPLGYYQIQNGKSVMIDPSPFNTAQFKLPSWFK